MHQLPPALAPFAAYRQFIVYQVTPSLTRPGKTDKRPKDPVSGAYNVDHLDPANQIDAQTAIAAAARLGAGYGVGFVFTANDPFWFLDIDAALLPDGQWSALAVALCAAFPGAAIEVSSSLNGLHIFGTGTCPPHGKTCKQHGLEFYTEGRFAALTGINAVGSAATDCSHLLPSLVAQFFPQSVSELAEWTDTPCPGWRGPVDDDDLLQRAMRSQSMAAAFGNRASFADLFNNDQDILARCYPDAQRTYDSSAADRALAQHLAFWTGKDCERMQRLMMRSALVREKWEREDYLPRTIMSAVQVQKEVIVDKLPEPVPDTPLPGNDGTGTTPVAEPPRATEVSGSTYLDVPQQIETFKGCVYVTDQHRVLVPGGALLKPEQFRVRFGGYIMVLDLSEGKTTRDAWEAFTQSCAYRCPRADSTCFKPDRAPGEIIHDAGRTRVNTWWPIETPRKTGDITPFLRHLALVLPDERDRTILLSYMSACVQHKGVKFQWAPFIQGTPGNGKTLFTRCVAEAVGRRYTHWPKASKLAAQFNGWLMNKVFIGVEDIYVSASKEEVIEELKPMITGGDGLEIEYKGVDQISADICANFIINSNHKNGWKKVRDDRRCCPFFTRQQSMEDVIASGMGGDYFNDLYSWLKGTGKYASYGAGHGYAIVSELLHTYPIPPEFNPAGVCQVAPMTTATELAIAEGLGGIEQEVLEAIAQNLPGFAGGWVSSMALDRMLSTLNATRRFPLNKRRELLVSLGYDWHPGLPDGRVNNVVTPDNGKPRLFVKRGSFEARMLGPTEIAAAYSAAQAVHMTFGQAAA